MRLSHQGWKVIVLFFSLIALRQARAGFAICCCPVIESFLRRRNGRTDRQIEIDIGLGVPLLRFSCLLMAVAAIVVLAVIVRTVVMPCHASRWPFLPSCPSSFCPSSFCPSSFCPSSLYFVTTVPMV